MVVVHHAIVEGYTWHTGMAKSIQVDCRMDDLTLSKNASQAFPSKTFLL